MILQEQICFQFMITYYHKFHKFQYNITYLYNIM